MVNKNYCHDVAAVLVTYNPDMEVLRAAIQAVSDQVSDVFIVDNASSNCLSGWVNKLEVPVNVKLHLLQQEENVGIGAGHNIGIRAAIEQGSKFVLLLDQDSRVGPDMVVKLRFAYAVLTEKGFQVAALGPQYCDADNDRLSQFVKIGLFRFIQCGCENNISLVEADFLVSSGSLLPVAALEVVGFMDESLFIDHVDTEWCLRAKSKGLQIFGQCGALMTHELGEQRKEVWFLRKRIVPFHKPFRYYYMFRNSVLLYRRGYMPLSWKFADMAKCFKMVFFFGWAAENRLTCLKMMFLGVIDGLLGIDGKRNGL